MQQKVIKDLIKEIAKKYNYSEDDVTKMVRSVFEYTTVVMRNCKKDIQWFPTIRIGHFLKFYCTEGKKRYYRQLINKQNEEEVK